jgi:hypothetical protein
MKGNLMKTEMTDKQRLYEIRKYLRDFNRWIVNPFFEPVIITEHPDYTVLVTPTISQEPAIEPPTVFCMENSDLLKLSRYMDDLDSGDETFDPYECQYTLFMGLGMKTKREAWFWDLFLPLISNQKGPALDFKNFKNVTSW